MQVTYNVSKCSECPEYCERYEFGEYTAYCGHKDASPRINSNAAYLHVGQDAVPKDEISYDCPVMKQLKSSNQNDDDEVKKFEEENKRLQKENKRLKADKKEIANRNWQIEEEYGKLLERFQQVQKVDKFSIVVDGGFLSWQEKNYVSEDLVEKALQGIKQASFTYHFEVGEYVGEATEVKQIVNLDTALDILNEHLVEGN